MLYRALDVVFQHFFKLIMLVLAVPLVAGAIGLALDHSQTVEARIWADKPIFTPSFATDRFSSNDSPAAIESGILSELIGTTRFDNQILTAVDSDYQGWNSDRQAGAQADLQQNMTVSAEGAHLFTVSYRTPNPNRGRAVLNATISAFGRQVEELDTGQVTATLAALQSQVDTAYRGMDDAVRQAQIYIAGHQSLNNDPTYFTLIAQAQSKTDIYLSAEAKLEEVKGNQAAVNTIQSSFFHVVDPPVVLPLKIDQHLPAVKYLLYALVGIGAAEALFVYTVARRDPRVRSVQDVRRVGHFRPLGSTPARLSPQ
jgi:hypothetical protein